MKKGTVMIAGVLLLLTSVAWGQSSGWLNPLRVKPLLSGNFGELRDSHFHSGLDYKTEGREGLPVICVKDGVLARVKVSATGYGNALYIEHADGYTTVYGHLQRFVPRVEEIVRDMQYAKESFAIDENFEAEAIVFKAGDTIAYSGNSGSSMGPHLHFEVRSSRDERPLNPLLFLRIEDTMGPTLRALYLYGFTEEGVLSGRSRVAVKNTGNRNYSAGRVRFPAGKVGIGIQGDDYMNGSWNKLGLYELKLWVGGRLISRMKMDTTSFDQNVLVNEVKDFQLYRENKVVYTTFGNYRDELPGVFTSLARGFITLYPDTIRQIRLELRDMNGNVSRLSFELIGREREREVESSENVIWDNRKGHRMVCENYVLELEPDALQYPISGKPQLVSWHKDSTETMEVFCLAREEWPLLKKGKLQVTGPFPEKSVLCMVGKGNKLLPMKTWRSETGLWAYPRVLGRYTVSRDTVAPQIDYLGKVAGKSVRFKIKDELTGIASYRVEVNGKWCLFSYDAKKNMLEGRLSEPAFTKGKNRLVLKVTDGVGNVATFETHIVK
ncbi:MULTISPECIES: M23 family metallopeptidase [Sanguibacteroides]|uniref:M23ase beta-sheet core domain-containing protein n=1 Tax=Sanguibacteroides justesenii TaxID=1547597 RepID=A0AB34R1H9_9PORP|nr:MULTISPECIES: M23 family metallopeptidase [Sanguibacteroides]KIO43057.1 hypothetical protein IE90_12625 [Sanguibacteroides justesenii]PXZ43261.1 M23 family peptidase [Sanguibacteroides justesenii]